MLTGEGSTNVIDGGIYEEQERMFPWYYLLPLLLIPLILFLILKENKAVADLEFLREAQKQGKLKSLNSLKIYVTPRTYVEIKNLNLKNIKIAGTDDEIALAMQLNIKKILAGNPDLRKIAESRGFDVFNLDEI